MSRSAMTLSTKQHEILRVAMKGNGRDAGGGFLPCDLDELVERLDYAPTKEAFHFSLRALIARGLLVKQGLEVRRGRRRLVIAPTTLTWQMLGAGGASWVNPTAEVVDTPAAPAVSAEGAIGELLSPVDLSSLEEILYSGS